MKRLLMIGLAVLATSAMASQGVVDFEELTLEANSFGPVLTGTPQYIPVSADFTSGGVTFAHTFTDWGGGWSSWDGFVYSNMTDTSTVDYSNQYSAITGGGADHSATYAVGYLSADYITGEIIPNRATLQTPAKVRGAYFTNTTYAHGVMKYGIVTEFFAFDPFGESDYLKLIIAGLDANGQQTDVVEFFLGQGQSVVDEWVWVDLSALGTVSQIAFSLEGTDFTDVHLNTPTYFAMDNLTFVPEPTTLLLLGSGAVITAMRRKWN